MESRLVKAYETLGLPMGSSLEQIKRKHRDLVKVWHPDKHRSDLDKELAHRKISEINAAYHYLKNLKYRSQRKAATQKSSTESGRNPSEQTTYQPKTQTQTRKSPKRQFKSTQKNYQERRPPNQFQPSAFDRWLSRWQNHNSYSRLHKQRIQQQKNWQKLIIKERENWIKLREKYNERTRVGLYRSLLNALIFGRIIQFESPIRAIGVFTMQEKYEIDLRHSLINDQIFYSINKGLNLLLKYIFGAFSVILFVFIMLMYYGYGIIPTMEQFLWFETGVLLQASLLFIPDNLLQRGMLWKFRHLQKSEIPQTFKNRLFPGKWNRLKQIVLSFKYLILFIYLHFFIQELPWLT